MRGPISVKMLDAPLSFREMDVMKLLAKGLPNKVIAKELCISNHTVKHHVHMILTKLNVPSRYAAALKARDEGWLG